MNQGDHGTRCKPPLKAHHDIDQYSNQRVDHGQGALLCQFLPHLGTDKFNAAHFHGSIQLAQARDSFLAELCTFLVGLWGNAYQHIARGTEMLDLRTVKTGISQGRSNRLELYRFRVAHFNQGATGKVNSEVKTLAYQRSK